MANVKEAGCVIGDCELLDVGDVLRVFDGDGGMVAEDVKKRDRVVAHLAGARVEDLDNTLNAFAAAQGHGDYGANDALFRIESLIQPRIVFRLGHDEGFGMFGDPAGDAFPDTDSKI